MSLVVFMKGVNVGGNKRFRPALLAKDLAAYDVVNIGAVGTFVAHGKITQAKLRAEITRRIPFESEIIIVPGRDLAKLVDDDPFPTPPAGVKRFVTVLAKKPTAPPALPITFPSARNWQLKIFDLRGRFALSLWRRAESGPAYPSDIYEKPFSTVCTTRGWETMVKVAGHLA